MGKRNATATKTGPGRRHESGYSAAKAPRRMGAPFGFVQYTNPAKNTRRAEFSRLGRRQALKLKKSLTRELKQRMTAAGML